MKALLCHSCPNCTTFALSLFGEYAEVWIWPVQPGFAGSIEISFQRLVVL